MGNATIKTLCASFPLRKASYKNPPALAVGSVNSPKFKYTANLCYTSEHGEEEEEGTWSRVLEDDIDQDDPDAIAELVESNSQFKNVWVFNATKEQVHD